MSITHLVERLAVRRDIAPSRLLDLPEPDEIPLEVRKPREKRASLKRSKYITVDAKPVKVGRTPEERKAYRSAVHAHRMTYDEKYREAKLASNRAATERYRAKKHQATIQVIDYDREATD